MDNEAAYCFDKWGLIVGNLTDKRMSSIDAHTFSVSKFYRASNIDWCLEYNEKVRRKERSQGGLPYSEGQIDDIFQHISSFLESLMTLTMIQNWLQELEIDCNVK